MTSWKITGIIATLVIIVSIPAYVLKEKYFHRPATSQPVATFTGNRKCMDSRRQVELCAP